MSERPPSFESNELHEYVSALRSHKWLIAAVTAFVLGTVMVRSYLETPSYRSEARVLLHLDGYINTQTEGQLLASEPIAEVAADTLDFEGDPSSLLGGLGVQASSTTEILTVSYVSEDPEVARARTQAFAEGYLIFKRERARDEAEAVNQQIATQVAGLNESINSLTDKLAETRDPVKRTNLQTQVNALVSQLALLEQEKARSFSPVDPQIGDVIQPASLPAAPFAPNYSQNAVLGTFLGLLLGVLAALLRERLDDRLRGKHDFESRLGRPVLAVIPKVPSWRRAKDAHVITLEEPHSVASEAYKTLRTSTLFVASSRGAKVLLIAGPRAAEGKTATLANLGVSLAHADRRIIIASADLRRPRLHRFFDLDNESGVTTVLSGETHLHDALKRVGVDKLRVLPSGPPPLNPAEVLGSEGMGALLDELRGLADLVLLDSPPVLAVADAIVLAPLTDGIIFIADPSKSSRSSVVDAVRQLEQVNADVIGGVLNNYDASGSFPYNYSEGYAPQIAKPEDAEAPGRFRLRRQARS